MKRAKKVPLSAQVKRHAKRSERKTSKLVGNTELMISTGSTLLDLAISGGRKHGGGIPGGVLIEIFGPEGSGKTILLCEIAGDVQRKNGAVRFDDTEARLNKLFARLFDLDVDKISISKSNTVTEMIEGVTSWSPENKNVINGAFTDSLAALSTNMEMESKDGDKYGMRRAKEFSEGFRKICRIITKNNYIMACSNQIRTNVDAGNYGEKFTTPGGKAVGFYASVRLRLYKGEKIRVSKKVKGKDIKKVVGIKTKVEVYKNSVDAPHRSAEIYIYFDYGVDDVRANLQYLKDYSSNSYYHLNDEKLDISMDKSIQIIEDGELEVELKEATISLWQEVQRKFETNRKKKKR